MDLIVCDGDDTLWKTQEVYDAAKTAFADLMDGLGGSGHNVIALLDRVDSEAVESQGFNVGRFADSMVRTYRVLSEMRGVVPDSTVEEKILRLTETLAGSSYELYPDTIPTLESLSARFRLVLATKGDRDGQARKVHDLALGRFFEHVYLLDRKSRDEYMEILSDCLVPPQRAVALGNSVRSDINPALEMGMRGVLISRPTWHYENEELGDGEVNTVDSLADAASAIFAMSGGGRVGAV